MKLPKDYPLKTSEKELKNIINQLTEDVVSSTGAGLVTNAGLMSLLRLGKLQLGINELQSRQSKRVMLFTVLTAIFSLIISLTALFMSVNGNRQTSIQETDKINLQKEMLIELRNLNERMVTKTHACDSINDLQIQKDNKKYPLTSAQK